MSLHASHDRTLVALSAITTNFPDSTQDALYPPKRLDAVHPSPIFTEPPTPSSSITVRRQSAFLIKGDREEDILPPMMRNSRTRSSSRTYKWIEEQQHHIATTIEPTKEDNAPAPIDSASHPYLAYPQMSAASLTKERQEGVARGNSYVLPQSNAARQGAARATRGGDAPVTQDNASIPTSPRKSQGIFHASPLRGLHLSFASRRPSAPVSSAPRPHSPASSTSTFRRNPERTASHSRSSGLSSASVIHRHARAEHTDVSASPPRTTAWKSRRPPVPGHFTPTSLDEESEGGSPPPRPSTSSSVTHSGSSTTYTRTSSDAPRKMHFGSIRSHSSTTIFSSSPSLWSLPTDASHINDPPESTKVFARDGSEDASVAWKPSAPTNFGSMSNILASPKARRKRKLIISGIPPDDERRIAAAKKWCESFGELNSLTHAPNGDLHVDFRKAEVADTVCRLNARVYIAGVGSVALSWFTGKRP